MTISLLDNTGVNLYAYEDLLRGLREGGKPVDLNQVFVKSLMTFVEKAKSNSHSELWKKYETSLKLDNIEGYFAPFFYKNGTFYSEDTRR